MRRLWLVAVLALTACGGCSTPVIPVVPVDPPGPTPVDPPGPVNPPTTGPGTITDAQYAALPDGSTEAQIVALVGKPYQSYPSGGFVIWNYLNGTTTVFFWLKNGVVDHRSNAP